MTAPRLLDDPDQGGTAFRRSWSARVLVTPPLIAPARHFTFPRQVPGEEEALQRGALLLEVKPRSGANFLATFALGFRDATLPTGVWPCPAPDELLAVAGGYAYRVPTLEPAGTVLLEQRPVTAVLPAPEAGLLLLGGFHDIVALGSTGVRWRTQRLSWEGLSLGSVSGSLLHGTGWDMFTDAEVPFTVDLSSGNHAGGGYGRSRT